MSQRSSTLTTALAGLALASLPMLVGAQGTAQRPSQPRATTQQNRSTDQNSPQHHLAEAKKVLNSIDASALKGDVKTQVVELRSHFMQLENAWQTKAAGSARSGAASSGHAGGHTGTGGTTSGTPAATTAGTTGTPEQAGATGATTRQAPRAETAPGATDNWMTHYQAIDNLLDRLLGDATASATGGAGVSAGATAGTTGASAGVTASAGTDIDAGTRAKLVEFRKHIELFHTTAMSQGRVGEEDAASAAVHSGVTGSMTQTKPSTGQTPPPTTSTEPTPTASASMSIDSAAVARLSAQIDDLIGSASTSSTSGTAGAVGTSGAVTGTVCVDRAKLEQLKRDIQALNRQ